MLLLEPVPLYFAKIQLILKSTKEFGRFLKRGQTLIISTTPSPSFQKEGKTYIVKLSPSAGSGTVDRGLLRESEDEGGDGGQHAEKGEPHGGGAGKEGVSRLDLLGFYIDDIVLLKIIIG